uniref:Uncharacterized protein n=1 Tax=Arundo donax TaxID=35708 RepID=A0A0A9HR68_ARUDO
MNQSQSAPRPRPSPHRNAAAACSVVVTMVGPLYVTRLAFSTTLTFRAAPTTGCAATKAARSVRSESGAWASRWRM